MALGAQFNDSNDKAAATVTAITRLQAGAAEIFLIRIRPPHGFTHQAGQYVDIGFGKLVPRSYSIASAPAEKEIEIHVKRAAGEASLYIASVLQVGDTVTLSPAHGHSTFDAHDTRPLLVIAGGMGLSAVKPVAEAAVHHNAAATVRLYWGTQTADEQYMRAHLEDMARQYDNFTFHAVSGAPVGDAVIRDMPDLSGYRIFVAGPPAMVAAVVPQLIARGAREEAISYDRHTPPGAASGFHDDRRPS